MTWLVEQESCRVLTSVGGRDGEVNVNQHWEVLHGRTMFAIARHLLRLCNNEFTDFGCCGMNVQSWLRSSTLQVLKLEVLCRLGTWSAESVKRWLRKLVHGSDPPGNREFPKCLSSSTAVMIRTAFSSSPASTLRRAIRHPTRFASSTTTEAAQKKAQDALGTAQKQAEQLFETAKKSLGPLGERIGIMLGGEWLSGLTSV